MAVDDVDALSNEDVADEREAAVQRPPVRESKRCGNQDSGKPCI